MNRILLAFCLVFSWTNAVIGQDNSHLYDTVLNRALERILRHPYEYTGGKFGVNIIKLSKKDSVFSLESVYKSDDKFAIVDSGNVLRFLNKHCGGYIPTSFELVIPILFNYDFEDLPSEILVETDKKLKKLKRRGENVSSLMVKVTGLQARR